MGQGLPGALPELLVWDREGCLHAGGALPTEAYARAEHHETQDHDHARLEERGQVPAEPSKADQDATFTSLNWMIGASFA